MSISVVYWSGTGNTQAMAEAVVEGINAERRAAYGHDLLQEAQNQQGRNHRAVLERAV